MRKTPQIYNFYLHRLKDKTGQSGTGPVAIGSIFPSGRTIIEWICSDVQNREEFNSFDEVLKIHGHSGSTIVIFGLIGGKIKINPGSEIGLPPGVKLKPGVYPKGLNEPCIFVDEKYGEFISSLRVMKRTGKSSHPKAVEESKKTSAQDLNGA